jgi:hypothetical protein
MELPETRAEIRFTRTPIYRAIRRHDLAALHRALRRSSTTSPPSSTAAALCRDENTRFSYVHLVVVVADAESESRLVPFVYALSNAGVDPDAIDCRRRTTLQLAVVKRLPGVARALLRIGSDQARRDYRALIARQPEPHRSVHGVTQSADRKELKNGFNLNNH